ncbi:MAG: MFS transporter [Chloroflexi bacterium]|nr:MFS transporter [Chloroflexota bacterium]MDA1145582.1 MFS transporter [Chloroflexota bacterium]
MSTIHPAAPLSPAPGGMLASFQEPEFRKVWLGAVLFGLGMWMERLAIGWFILDETGSVFLAALSFAIRTVPNLVLGPIGGAASDRLPRARVLAVTSWIRMLAAALMALVVLVDVATIPALMVLVFLTGATIAFQNTALQPLQAEIVGPARLSNAISLTSLGQRSIGVIGALSGGIFIAWLGPAATFLIGALPLAAAALVFGRVRPAARPPRAGTRFATEVLDGLRLAIRTPMVRLLLGMMILVEILGFSFNGLLPAVAERVLEVGPERLGVLTAGVSVGAMIGTLFLVVVGDRLPRGLMLIAVFATFGTLLLVLGNSTVFWLSVLAAGGVGASAAMVDALEWIMLQHSVPEELRGRALGGWNFAIGWGWIGPIALGAIADATTVPTALTLSGSLLVVAAIAALLLAKPLRAR